MSKDADKSRSGGTHLGITRYPETRNLPELREEVFDLRFEETEWQVTDINDAAIFQSRIRVFHRLFGVFDGRGELLKLLRLLVGLRSWGVLLCFAIGKELLHGGRRLRIQRNDV